jgi:hypothetical protein
LKKQNLPHTVPKYKDLIEEVTDDDDQTHTFGSQSNADNASNGNHEFSDENKNLILHLLPTLKGKYSSDIVHFLHFDIQYIIL